MVSLTTTSSSVEGSEQGAKITTITFSAESLVKNGTLKVIFDNFKVVGKAKKLERESNNQWPQNILRSKALLRSHVHILIFTDAAYTHFKTREHKVRNRESPIYCIWPYCAGTNYF